MKKYSINESRVTGLDVAKLLGPEAVKAYEVSKEQEMQLEQKAKRQIREARDMFKKLG